MRRVLTMGFAGLTLIVALAACGGSGKKSASGEAVQKQADLYAIDQIEAKWHEAESHRDINEKMSLWAPNATWTVDPVTTVTGKKSIRSFFVKDVFPVARKQQWFSDTATFKIRTTVNGDKGTLYFECDEIDLKTRKVVAVVGQDLNVAKINGRWLITSSVGASPTLGA